MRGYIKQRSKRKGSYSIVISLGRDPETKKKRQHWETIRGTKKDAEKRLSELLHQQDVGLFVRPGKLTVAKLLGQWLQDYALSNVRSRTYDRYAEIIRRHLIPALGALPLKSLQPHHIQSYYGKALQSGRYDGKGGLSERTVHHHHRVLFSALKYAVKHNILARNVAEAVDPPRPGFKEMATTDAEGLFKLLEAVRGTQYYTIFYTAAYSGLRRSEILALRWQHVDLELCTLAVVDSLHQLHNGEFDIRPPKSKRGKRLVALSPSLAILLREHKAEQEALRNQLGLSPLQQNDLVFSQPDGSFIRPDSVTSKFRKVAKSVGLENLRFHDLRHTHATLMLQQGVHPKIVSERLGHSSIALTLDTYSHVLPGLQEAAAKAFDENLAATRLAQQALVSAD